ncbi:MAG: (Fe-S)-binding protein, partial [Alphaproteobacteria bacterium]
MSERSGKAPREGSLDAPTRHPLRWQEPEFTDPEKLDAEMRRVFDICHGCRRCFNLCDSFPRLFDLIDESETGELDAVPSERFKHVVDACTLCDMCFMTKCPYVPPHEFDLDFPHLMLRYRAMEQAQGRTDFVARELGRTDRNGRLLGPISGVVNWATDEDNPLTRPPMHAVLGIHREAHLPRYHSKAFVQRAKEMGQGSEASAPAGETAQADEPEVPAAGRKAVLYATCFVNYNNPGIGEALHEILTHNGVALETVHPGCCGMPRLEQGEIAAVAESAQKVAEALIPYVDEGHDVIALVPSCALMLKFEWPLILPENENVKRLAAATFDPSQYIVDIAKKEGLAPGLKPLDGPVSMHLACHARAQNMGAKAVEMLRLIPEMQVKPIERCSGHGGTWGVMKENFEV